jgi:hypothetical protein
MGHDRIRASLILPAGGTPEGRRAELVRAAKATSLGAVLGMLLALAARARGVRGEQPRERSERIRLLHSLGGSGPPKAAR